MYDDRNLNEEESEKKESLARRAGRLAAGAVLFGVVAGAVKDEA